MNTKKAIWVKRPTSHIKTNLHSYSYENEEKSAVFFTVGEEGAVKLEAKASEGVQIAFTFLHTPSDYVSFTEGGIDTVFFGLRSHTNLEPFHTMEMKKAGENLSFYADEILIMQIENPAFLGSASFGVQATGAGSVEIQVY